jgi:DNA-binding Lrp family transcriptional regulator
VYEAPPAVQAPPPSPGRALDEVDRRIILVLERDARLSARAIARQIGMSPGAVSERIERLEGRGVILGYHAHVNPDILGYGVEAIVCIETDQGPALTEMLDRLMELAAVERAHVVSGRWDVLVHVRVRDQVELRDLILSHISTIPGFRHTETMMSWEVRQGRAGMRMAPGAHPQPQSVPPVSGPRPERG